MDPARPKAYLFSAAEVWSGLPIDEPIKYCNGLIADWATWQLEDGDAFMQLQLALRTLSPGTDEHLEPGALLPKILREKVVEHCVEIDPGAIT